MRANRWMIRAASGFLYTQHEGIPGAPQFQAADYRNASKFDTKQDALVVIASDAQFTGCEAVESED